MKKIEEMQALLENIQTQHNQLKLRLEYIETGSIVTRKHIEFLENTIADLNKLIEKQLGELK